MSDKNLKSLILEKIKAAAENSNVTEIGRLSSFAKELEALEEQEVSIGRRKKEISEEIEMPSKGSAILRKFYCQITGGCLRQNLLTLTRQVQLGKIKTGEILKIELPDGSTFKTDIAPEGNKLRERGAIAKFYRDYDVREGNYVVLEEIIRGEWKLRKARVGEERNWL
jgi:hypothetical protein